MSKNTVDDDRGSKRTRTGREAAPGQRPAPDSGVPLRDYAAIGDGRTVALISLRGDIDWLPIPDMNSVPVFAALLDEADGGRISLAPTEEYSVRRRYVPGTNVLQTTFTTEGGAVRVTDALVTGLAGRLPWAELVRQVEGVRGEVRVSWSVRPGTCLGTVSPWIQTVDHTTVIRAGDITIGVAGRDHGAKRARGGKPGAGQLEGSFTTNAGSSHVIGVVATHDEPLHVPKPDSAERNIRRTIDSWRAWSKDTNYSGPWAPAVKRSALALKLLIFSPTGSIAAAATTSLPESKAGGKNWDYRFSWVRDTAYSLRALIRFGLEEETHAALSWLLNTIKANGPQLYVFYDLNGGVSSEVHEYESPGWSGIGPVVSGNPAKDQLQLGVYGDLIGIALSYVLAGNTLDIGTARLLTEVADRVCDAWRSPDSGMWELSEQRHYSSSKMGCWQALDAAVRLAEMGQLTGSGDRWRLERDQIREWVDEHCWSEDRSAYLMYPGSDALDTSVLLHAPSGFDRGPRMAATIDAIIAELSVGPLLYRYSGVDREESTFVASAFWLASALACVGRLDEATTLMDELVGLANDVGLFAEMIDSADSSFWGNFPQGLSHLALINTAIVIEELSATKS